MAQLTKWPRRRRTLARPRRTASRTTPGRHRCARQRTDAVRRSKCSPGSRRRRRGSLQRRRQQCSSTRLDCEWRPDGPGEAEAALAQIATKGSVCIPLSETPQRRRRVATALDALTDALQSRKYSNRRVLHTWWMSNVSVLPDRASDARRRPRHVRPAASRRPCGAGCRRFRPRQGAAAERLGPAPADAGPGRCYAGPTRPCCSRCGTRCGRPEPHLLSATTIAAAADLDCGDAAAPGDDGALDVARAVAARTPGCRVVAATPCRRSAVEVNALAVEAGDRKSSSSPRRESGSI